MTKTESPYAIPADLQEWALANWHLVDRLAHRRFPNETMAQEASLFAMEKISGNNWHTLRNFAGKSRFSTFFCSVAYRALEDFARKKFGRLRPPAWLKRMGGIWLYLFRLLCQERYTFHEAIELATGRFRQQTDARLVADQILTEIPSCGKKQYESVVFDENTPTSDQEPQSRQHQNLEDEEQRQLLAALSISLFGSSAATEITAPLAKRLRDSLHLTNKERLLLKLCHREGVSVSHAGRMLGLNRFQIHGQLKRLYKRIHEQLLTAGITGELQELFKD